MDLTEEELTVLRAALPILQKIVASAPKPKLVLKKAATAEEPLPRSPDGRHLTREAVLTLYDFFDGGGTPYGAAKKFGIHFNSARERHVAWRQARVSNITV